MTTFIANAKEKVLVEKAVISKPVGYDAGCADFDSVVSYRQHIASLRRIQAPFLTEEDEGREMVEGVDFEIQGPVDSNGLIVNERYEFFAVPIPTEQQDYYPGSYYQPLFNLMSNEHGINLVQSQMDDIIQVVQKLSGEQSKKESEEHGTYWYKDDEFPNQKVRMDGIREFIMDSGFKLSGEDITNLLKGIGYWHLKRLAATAPPVSDGVEQRGKDSEDLLRPCDCKDEVDAQKLNEQGIGHNDEIVSVHPNYVLLKMGHTEIKIGMKRFKMFAEWYLQPQNINKH